MNGVERFGVSMAPDLLKRFDEAITARGYSNRSEAIRDIVRDFLVEQEWESDETEVIGTITVVYDHRERDLRGHLTEVQHHYHPAIISTLHVHLDAHHCLEVVVVRGPASVVHHVADHMIRTRGVKHGKLTCTTTGRDLG
ncbi:MAG: nickel-responsive transcriptional regulator NikR [Armatimonadetes bacterium]|jgi:CopG family nickel-responsive transcriptional regulator|nr:nickel-responsive transcriptional regulator NikR [Armatimonadota bacterium]